MLEPCEGKLSSTVLRGKGSPPTRLSPIHADPKHNYAHRVYFFFAEAQNRKRLIASGFALLLILAVPVSFNILHIFETEVLLVCLRHRHLMDCQTHTIFLNKAFHLTHLCRLSCHHSNATDSNKSFHLTHVCHL